MAARDAYKIDVECPTCLKKGAVHLSEDDYPFMTNPHRSIDLVEGQFWAGFIGPNTIEVTCKGCRMVVKKY